MSELIARDGGPLSALVRDGRGHPVVLLHGMLADVDAWRDVIRSLAPGRPLLAPNRRGRGRSTDVGLDHSIQTEVDDLRGWVGTLPSPPDLVAHSFGGLIAVEAVRQGLPVRSLTLYEPVVRPFAPGVLPALRRASSAGDLDALVSLVNIEVSGYPEPVVRQLRRGPAWSSLRELARPIAAELNAVERFDPDLRRWADLDVPITLIAGSLSVHRSPYGDALDVYRATFPAAPVRILEGADHLAHVTAPSELAALINDILVAPLG